MFLIFTNTKQLEHHLLTENVLLDNNAQDQVGDQSVRLRQNYGTMLLAVLVPKEGSPQRPQRHTATSA